jgi:hypothetical protein
MKSMKKDVSPPRMIPWVWLLNEGCIKYLKKFSLKVLELYPITWYADDGITEPILVYYRRRAQKPS